MATDYAETILAAFEKAADTGGPDTRAAIRTVLREVAPERLLPPQPPIGTPLRYDGTDGPELLVRTRKGYKALRLGGGQQNPELDWRYVSKLPGLTQLVPNLAGTAPALPWSPEATPDVAVTRAGDDMLSIDDLLLNMNDIRALAAICQSMLPTFPVAGSNQGPAA